MGNIANILNAVEQRWSAFFLHELLETLETLPLRLLLGRSLSFPLNAGWSLSFCLRLPIRSLLYHLPWFDGGLIVEGSWMTACGELLLWGGGLGDLLHLVGDAAPA